MIRYLAAVAAFALLAPEVPAPAISAAQEDDARFTLGVLRRDGVVIPFASWDGGSWSSNWPSDLRAQELPISLADVPERWWGRAGAPAKLTLWSEGVSLGPVGLEKPAMIPIMCSTRLALRSDYKSKEPLPPPIEQPYPKDGLVISGGHDIRPLTPVARGSSEWNATPIVIRNEFDRIEDLAARSFTDWEHPFSREQRRQIPIQVEALYRVPMDEEGWAAYYVEAVRQYKPGPDDGGCGLVTFVSGWIRLGPEGGPIFDLGARVSYCDRRGAMYMLPLGVVTVDDKIFWVYQTSGHLREWLVVARPTPSRIELHVEYAAGLCPTV